MSEQREREILDRLDNAHVYSAGGMSTQAGDDVRYLYEQLGVARGNIIAALACVERAEARADEAERLCVELWDQSDAACEGLGPDLVDDSQPCAHDCDHLDDCAKIHAMRVRQSKREGGGK